MTSVNLSLIQEIDHLWEPVYPYLAREIYERYGRREGTILEIGPFCGVIFNLAKKHIGDFFSIATFPEGMGDFFRQEAKKEGLEKEIGILETDPSLVGMAENGFDLAIFRGAFFFPSLFKVEFSAVYRVLRTGGVAVMGGGFGKFTPDSVIKDIGKRSRDLNLQIGKTEVDKDQLWHDIQKSNLTGQAEVISDGGLWVLMKK